MKVIFTLLFALIPALALTQTTYYVDPAGSYLANGTSTGTAWRTVSKAQTVTAGSTVLFKRGSTWNETLTPANSGTSGSRITFGAYGTGARPIISATKACPPGDWTHSSGYVWTRSTGSNPIRVKIDNVEYPHSTSAGAIDGTWRWYWSGSTLTVYGNSTTTAPTVEISYESNESALVLGGDSYITFNNINFRGGSSCVDQTGGSNYITYDSCDIGDMTGSYGMWVKQSTHGEIKNSNVDRKDHNFYTIANPPDFGGWTQGGADCISLRNGSSYWDIHDNYIAAPGHDAVAIGSDTTISPEPGCQPCVSDTIRNNEMYGGRGYCRAINIHGGYPGTDARVYGNYVHGFTEQWQLSGLRNWFYYNLIDTVNVPSDRASGEWYQCGGMSGSDAACVDMRIFNNTIRNVDGPGIKVDYGWTTPYVENNIIYNTGREYHGSTVDSNFYHVGIEIQADYSGGWVNRTGGTFRNNIIFGTSDSNRAVIWLGASNQGAPVSNKVPPGTFNGYNGTNSMVISGNRFIDPDLLPTLKINAASVAIDAGVTVTGTFTDYWGNAIVGAPDVGAYEWTSTNVDSICTVTTSLASDTTASSAVLDGLVDANSTSTTARFIWGASSGSYTDSATATGSPVTGTTNTAISYTLTGLSASTAYYFRAAGTNAAGYARGAEQTFTTLAGDTTAPILGPTAKSGVYFNVDTISASVSVGADSNRALIAYVVGWNSGGFPAVSAITCGGNAVTLVGSVFSPSGNHGVRMYRKTAPAIGNNTVSVTMASASSELGLIVSTWSNVNQSYPTGTVYTQSGTGTGGTSTLNVQGGIAGDIIVDCSASFSMPFTGLSSGQTEVVKLDGPTTYKDAWHTQKAGASSVNMTQDFVADGGYAWIGVALKGYTAPPPSGRRQAILRRR